MSMLLFGAAAVIAFGLTISTPAVASRSAADVRSVDTGLRVAETPRPHVGLAAPALPAVHIALPPTVAPKSMAHTGPSGTDCVEIGYTRGVTNGLLDGVPWQPVPGGFVRRVELSSSGAKGMRVRLSGPFPSRLAIRVYAPGQDRSVHGPYTAPIVDAEGKWWSPTVFGESLGLEFYWRSDDGPPNTSPTISEALYMYNGPSAEAFDGSGAALGCELDVSCYSDWSHAEAAGVARLYFISGGQGYVCSGELMNRDVGDASPIMMTANHCISDTAAAATLNTVWFYKTPVCNGVPPAINTLPQTNGALLLKNVHDYDCTLVGLNQPPPAGAMFLPWDAGTWTYGKPIVGIHYPGGEYERIMMGHMTNSGVRTFKDIGDVSIWFVNVEQGTVEPGSSGSPVFDLLHHVRGVLTGSPNPDDFGSGPCPPYQAFYGRFDLAYPTLQPYLANIASPVYVDPGYAGDEKGTSSQPFNTLREATFAVRGGDTVALRAVSMARENSPEWRR